MWSRYTTKNCEDWNNFIKENEHHFMFLRSYMDYHSDRFEDHSFVYIIDNEIKMLIPATIKGNEIYSHGGLTFGGILKRKENQDIFTWIETLSSLKEHLKDIGIEKIHYKPTPSIYLNDNYLTQQIALINTGFTHETCGISMSINLENEIKYSSRRKRMIKKAKNLNYKETTVEDFYPVLEDLLETKYDTKPVHTLEELTSLSQKHPEHIKCFSSQNDEGNILAGVICFITKSVVHLQYIATSDEGRSQGALDGLTDHLIQKYKDDYLYFDFGTSMNRDGSINLGLLKQKSEFGSSPTSYDLYTLIL